MTRADLVPRPDAESTSDLTQDARIVGMFGCGMFLLFSERFRFISGYDWRKRDGLFEPHPHSRNLVSGRKCLYWMHHPYLPYAIVERDHHDCDLYLTQGSFGVRTDFGDGTEANFPQYGILKMLKDRKGRIFEDGAVLEIRIETASVLRSLTSFECRFEHVPGSLKIQLTDCPSIEEVILTAPSDQRGGLVLLRRRMPFQPLTLEVRCRALLKELTVAPSEHRAKIDVLDAPFGFQKFIDHSLIPEATAGGVRFRATRSGLSTFLVTRPAPEEVAVRSADACEERFDCGPFAEAVDRAPARCFDVGLRVRAGDDHPSIRIAFGLECDSDRSRTPVTLLCSDADSAHRAIEGDSGSAALRLFSGDRYLDGLLRFSRNVAHALVWPNGVITTGALGYSGKSHVGQDVPFIHPLFVMDPNENLRRAGARMLAYVVDSDSARDGAGILDHPCEGRDFAFVPMRPTSARIYKNRGVAGLLRWMLCLERYFAFSGDLSLSRRGFERFKQLYLAHFAPLEQRREAWARGEETQELGYSLTTAAAALTAMKNLAEHFGDESAETFASEARNARDLVNRPLADGGLWVSCPLARDDFILPEGWIAHADLLKREGQWFGFDLPLVAGHALKYGALELKKEQRLADLLCDSACPWRVEGAGFSKSPFGEKGVWFWHNALLAQGLMNARRVDAADRLFQWMGMAIADINGIGIPGEETNGGDYAMGIGALAGLCLVESLLGLAVRAGEVFLEPRLPSRLSGFAMDGLWLCGRSLRIEVVRTTAATQVPAPVRLDPSGRTTELRFEV